MKNYQPKALTALDIISAVLLFGATLMVFFYAPVEAIMGPVQKVFYFHVATGWVGMLGFLVAAIAGGIFLKTGDFKWDMVSVSAVELGIVFALINVVTGAIWARPIWNTWWTWDPRLTTAAIMELIYAAYLMLRAGIEDPNRRARFAAVYAIVGFISVPLTFLSIRFSRTIHPVVIGSGDSSALGTFNMTGPMSTTFVISLVVFSIIFIDLLWHRIQLGKLEKQVEEQKALLDW
ncbi:MAG: cytochrome c biogenesis protein CcsA [Anaerolineaceae bacterium]|nr:cytochrome c biogenesis protein CcsA [Anaerolineaceae bacterium]NTV35849.1 cytochrome c biogenesis protein CcsA [Anaerolineaceae bacterium]